MSAYLGVSEPTPRLAVSFFTESGFYFDSLEEDEDDEADIEVDKDDYRENGFLRYVL